MLAVNWLERFWNSVGIPGNAVVKSTVSTSTKLLDLRPDLRS